MKRSKISISPIITEIHEDTTNSPLKTDLSNIPVMALRDTVLMPGITTPISVGREKSLNLVKRAEESHQEIALFLQKDASCDDPGFEDLYHIGVTAQVMKVIQLPDDTITAVIHAHSVVSLKSLNENTDPFLSGSVTRKKEKVPKNSDEEMRVAIDLVKDIYDEILQTIPDNEASDLRFALKNFDNPFFLLNFLIVNSPLQPDIKQSLLATLDLKQRAIVLASELRRSLSYLQIKMEIQNRTREELSQQQREHFLHQQIRSIQEELGVTEDNDFEELRKRAREITWSEENSVFFEKEVRKLERYNPQSPEYAVQYQYLETLLSLPWQKYTTETLSLSKAEKILNRDHYGLSDVKERILEQLAVLEMRNDMKAPIICLYGPPGVGKTSLGKSIATAMGRDYARVSLGGLHDEAEIRGHRRTYIGALPGRIIASMLKVDSSNPVIVLDEIDKIGNDFKGDPSTALLEVLDPEQNSKFHDNYIDVDYDLSKVLFIATANTLSSISRPLLDRMELIEITGYTTEEKIQIAKRHLVPKVLEETGFGKKDITFRTNALKLLIESYTRESGVRRLEKNIARILRKIAKLKVSNKDYPTIITDHDVKSLLGAEEYTSDSYENNDYAGVVTGLAWTQVGGEILFIESSLSSGNGEKLTLTGNLGDVMKESAVIAMQYLKSHADEVGIDEELFAKNNVHIHVPEGAIPKDGPSAGITMVTSLASSFTRRKVRSKLAMTGEITLRGKVLPVGGIKEKILAAKRAGITDIILSAQNRKDIEKIDAEYLKGLNFHYVDRISEVLDFALLDERV